MTILVAALLVLPVLGAQIGVDLNIVSRVIGAPIETIIRAIVLLTGNDQRFVQ